MSEQHFIISGNQRLQEFGKISESILWESFDSMDLQLKSTPYYL